MKTTKLILSTVFYFGLLSGMVFAQDDVTVPTPPPEPFIGTGFNYMSQQDEQEALKKVPANLRDDLEFIKKNNKSKYYQLLQDVRFKRFFNSYTTGASAFYIDENRNKDKDTFSKENELNIQSEVLAIKYKTADASNKQNIKNQLKAKLSELFELKEKSRKDEVAQLEKKLVELKKNLDLRNSHKDEIIIRKMEEMLGESRIYRWDQ